MWILRNCARKIAKSTALKYFAVFRKMISFFLREFLPFIELPGPVELDETFIGSRRIGRIPGRHETVFGGALNLLINWFLLGIKCRSTGRIIIYHVPDKSAASLVPIILNHVPEGATIYSDKASMYVNNHRNTSRLDELGYEHYWVNHSETWVNEVSPDVHTNNIERTWRSLKGSISYIKRSMQPEILDEYINTFILKANTTKNNLTDILFSIISLIFD